MTDRTEIASIVKQAVIAHDFYAEPAADRILEWMTARDVRRDAEVAAKALKAAAARVRALSYFHDPDTTVIASGTGIDREEVLQAIVDVGAENAGVGRRDLGYGIRWCKVCETTQPLYVTGYMVAHRKADGTKCGGSHWVGEAVPAGPSLPAPEPEETQP